ncbi:MAG: RNA polymerase sigma factor RpoD/SigA [Fusobacteria bacterium]|nr:RNA polymerase sigma factor RpoD/SigA [Fusobacteriota bacterium]
MKKNIDRLKELTEKIEKQLIKNENIDIIIEDILGEVDENEYETIIDSLISLDNKISIINNDYTEDDYNIKIKDINEKNFNDENVNKFNNKDILRTYFNEIENYKLLTYEEEKDLIIRYQNGDEEAKNELVLSNLKLVAKIALNYDKRGIYYLDLIQDGTIGLMKAIEKFDISKNYKLSTYATWWIKKEILKSLRERLNFIKIPGNILKDYQKIREVEQELANKKGINYKIEDVSKKTGIKVENIIKIKEIMDKNAIKSSDDSNTLEIEDHSTEEEIDKNFEIRKNSLKIESLLNRLSEIERNIIEMYFGLEGNDSKNYREIGKELNLSSDKVRIIAKQAIQKLRFHRLNEWREDEA